MDNKEQSLENGIQDESRDKETGKKHFRRFSIQLRRSIREGRYESHYMEKYVKEHIDSLSVQYDSDNIFYDDTYEWEIFQIFLKVGNYPFFISDLDKIAFTYLKNNQNQLGTENWLYKLLGVFKGRIIYEVELYSDKSLMNIEDCKYLFVDKELKASIEEIPECYIEEFDEFCNYFVKSEPDN